jgi:hypothetical protein
MTTTTNLSDFGHRELHMAGQLLMAISSGLPTDFYDDGVHVMMNQNSGNVFLTNNDYQVAMMNGNDLESFYSCPICGHEGFLDELDHGDDDSTECKEWLKEVNEAQ